MRHTISCLVRNRPGVLARVASSFADRGINIHSLAVNESDQEEVSRITVVVEGEKDQIEAIAGDMTALDDIVQIEDLDRRGFLDRELVLVKVRTKPEDLPRLMQIIDVMRANVAAMDIDTMTVEMTGTEEKISAFVRLVRAFGIEECARSGRVAVSAGTQA